MFKVDTEKKEPKATCIYVKVQPSVQKRLDELALINRMKISTIVAQMIDYALSNTYKGN